MKQELLKKIRKLSKLLLASGSLNIFMAALLFYWYFVERPPTPVCERKPITIAQSTAPKISTFTNEELLRGFEGLTFPQLVGQLKNLDLADNGFSMRHIALGSLISHHHLDFNKAMLGKPKPAEKRYLTYKDRQGRKNEIITYSDVTDEHFDAILTFVQTEKWPQTPYGLFLKLKSPNSLNDPNMQYAFYITPEYLTIELLLKRADPSIERVEILSILLEGTWESLASFTERQRISQDLSDVQRRIFLLSYIDNGSATAAELLLKTDFNYAAKKLDDDHAATILKLTKKRTPESARFALTMLASPRSNKVWEEAAGRLYEFAGETNHSDRNTALMRFLPLAKAPEPKPSIIPKPTVKSDKWKRGYTVQTGDSLWKISRRFNVDLSELKNRNSITTDWVKPGTLLLIP